MYSDHINVKNNIDMTQYEIVYYMSHDLEKKYLTAKMEELDLNSQKENTMFDKIKSRIMEDVIEISKYNKTRSKNLSFVDVKMEITNNGKTFRFYTDKTTNEIMYLSTCCTYYIKL